MAWSWKVKSKVTALHHAPCCPSKLFINPTCRHTQGPLFLRLLFMSSAWSCHSRPCIESSSYIALLPLLRIQKKKLSLSQNVLVPPAWNTFLHPWLSPYPLGLALIITNMEFLANMLSSILVSILLPPWGCSLYSLHCSIVLVMIFLTQRNSWSDVTQSILLTVVHTMPDNIRVWLTSLRKLHDLQAFGSQLL